MPKVIYTNNNKKKTIDIHIFRAEPRDAAAERTQMNECYEAGNANEIERTHKIIMDEMGRGNENI